MKIISTIGYEQAELADFLNCLKTAKIDLVIDVRELPLSRRRGFSKTALSSALADHDVEYLHLRALGDPPDGRAAARAGEWIQFNRIFSRHLRTKSARKALGVACQLARSARACLLCYERDPSTCHRTMVVSAICDIIGLKVQHLYVPNGREEEGSDKQRRRKAAGPSKGIASRGHDARRDGMLRGGHRETAMA
jgi:uncharacterized protein (DUF488 family)